LRITTNQDIAGYPALKVRNFIKSYRSGGFFRKAAEAALDLSPEAAATLLLKLVDLGLIEEVQKRIDGELIFKRQITDGHWQMLLLPSLFTGRPAIASSSSF
jgi:hypothetical protein